MKDVMMEAVGIYRNAEHVAEAVEQLENLREAAQLIRVSDMSNSYNTDLLEVLELHNLLALAYMTAVFAYNLKETRGAHARVDLPQRDAAKYLKHTHGWLEDGAVRLGDKSVDLSIWAPKPRVY